MKLRGIYRFLLAYICFLSVRNSCSFNLPESLVALATQYQQNPDDNEIKYAFGNNLLALGNTRYQEHKLEDALEIYQYLTTLFPDSCAVYHNLGYTLAELNRPHEAIEAYQHALQGNPTNQETHMCLAGAYLAANNYRDGFREYEWRWRGQQHPLASFGCPVWEGQSLIDKTMLLHSEGSLGDVLQFVRYAQELKQRGAYIMVRTFKTLIPLLSRCSYIDMLVHNQEAVPQADYQLSLMSVPYLLDTTYPHVYNSIPYLHPDPALVAYWHEQLAHDPSFKIGICWQADPHNDANRPLLARRSIELSAFEPLAAVPGVTLYSLQSRDGVEQLRATSWIRSFEKNFDDDHGSFMDTAAVMMHLDLIITVDTSVAHLAGALGRPVWLILPYKADWRWSYSGTTTPWYPTIHIWRKSYQDPWSHLVEKVCTTLKKLVYKG